MDYVKAIGYLVMSALLLTGLIAGGVFIFVAIAVISFVGMGITIIIITANELREYFNYSKKS